MFGFYVIACYEMLLPQRLCTLLALSLLPRKD